MNHLLLRRLWASSSGISGTTTHYRPVTLSKVISVKAASCGSWGTSGCVQDMIQKGKKTCDERKQGKCKIRRMRTRMRTRGRKRGDKAQERLDSGVGGGQEGMLRLGM